MLFKLSTLLALALASTSLALPSPISPASGFPKRWDNECTKPKGEVCGSDCYDINPTDFIKACKSASIDISASVGVQAILKGALSAGGSGGASLKDLIGGKDDVSAEANADASVDVDVEALAKIDAELKAKWGEVCGYAHVPADKVGKVSLVGKLDLSIFAQLDVSVSGFLGGILGIGSCGPCHW